MKRMMMAGVILGIVATGCSNEAKDSGTNQGNGSQPQVSSTAPSGNGAGKVMYVLGALLARRADGTAKVMALESDVRAGDVLATSKDSYALIQMNDGAKMTLLPNSNLKIVDYRFNKDAPQLDNAVFNLLKGGLRSVTGLIGKRGNVDAYRMQSSMATIGIRGTDFSSRLCSTQNCQDDVAESAKLANKPQIIPHQAAGGTSQDTPVEAPPGLYVTVHNGQVIVAQPTGKTLSLERGETAFADTATLVRLPEPPVFMIADAKRTSAIGENVPASAPVQQDQTPSSGTEETTAEAKTSIYIEIRKQDYGDKNLCLLTYLENKSNDTRTLNLFGIRLEGVDGSERNPSILINKDPVFPYNKELEPGSKALGWICFGIPSVEWKPSAIDIKDIIGERIAKYKF